MTVIVLIASDNFFGQKFEIMLKKIGYPRKIWLFYNRISDINVGIEAEIVRNSGRFNEETWIIGDYKEAMSLIILKKWKLGRGHSCKRIGNNILSKNKKYEIWRMLAAARQPNFCEINSDSKSSTRSEVSRGVSSLWESIQISSRVFERSY